MSGQSIPPSRPRRATAWPWLRGGLIVLVQVSILFPILWMVLAALKTNLDISDPSKTFAFTATLDNFRTVFQQEEFLPYMLNSLIVGGVSTGLSLLLAVPASWSVARFSMHRTSALILLARIIPAISLLVPWYYLFAQVGLVGGYTALVLSHMFTSVPLITWIMIGFFQGIPVDLEEAARMDGLSQFQTFLRISLPLTAPGIATSAVLAFIFSWNNFIFALILADESTKTLPVALFNFMSYASVDWGGLMAASSVMTIPVIVLALFGQKYIVSGLTAGATKG